MIKNYAQFPVYYIITHANKIKCNPKIGINIITDLANRLKKYTY
jgi:hypothetical protein